MSQQRTRADIWRDIAEKKEQFKKLQYEIRDHMVEDILLCDDAQWFTEKEEDVIVSRRPKKVEKKRIARIHWNEFFRDMAYPDDEAKGVWITRSRIVRINDEWV